MSDRSVVKKVHGCQFNDAVNSELFRSRSSRQAGKPLQLRGLFEQFLKEVGTMTPPPPSPN
jgi:hypothetical protein